MSGQPQLQKAAAEEVQLNLLPVSGEEQNNLNHEISGREVASCCPDSYYRKLAICSIICGLSCIGCKALIYSVKVLSGAFICTYTVPRHYSSTVTCIIDVFYIYILMSVVLDSTG